MSHKNDFRKAHTHVINAEKLTKRHLDPLEWPATFRRFDLLLATLNYLTDPEYTGPPETNESPHDP